MRFYLLEFRGLEDVFGVPCFAINQGAECIQGGGRELKEKIFQRWGALKEQMFFPATELKALKIHERTPRVYVAKVTYMPGIDCEKESVHYLLEKKRDDLFKFERSLRRKVVKNNPNRDIQAQVVMIHGRRSYWWRLFTFCLRKIFLVEILQAKICLARIKNKNMKTTS